VYEVSASLSATSPHGKADRLSPLWTFNYQKGCSQLPKIRFMSHRMRR
jgi:hypothetical protein